MRFGVLLPTYSPERLDYKTAMVIRDFAVRAERLRFDSLWVADHMLSAPGMFGGSCLSPLLCLSHAAAVTERVRLGTSILILAIRNPVMVAKDLATLDALSSGRLVLGAGVGWNPHVFGVAGVPRAERGSRTDEALTVIRRLLSEPSITHRGKHYTFENVGVTPRPPVLPAIWIAGGAEPAQPRIAPSVLRRITAADGWIARARASNAMIKEDWRQISEELARQGRRRSGFTFAHLNFLHVVPGTDRDEVLACQRPVFEKAMGTQRSWEQLQQSHLTGTTSEIIERIRDLERAGLEEMILCPLDYDAEQLERYAEGIMPHFCN